MARGRTHPLESLIDTMARWPWWAGVLAAMVSGLLLQALMYFTISGSDAPSGGSWSAFGAATGGLVQGLQYLLPVFFLVAAAMSAWLDFRRRRNYAAVAGERGHAALELLSWREFENLVGEFFRRKGFHVEQRTGGEADGGVDLVASIGEDRYLVQCKHWRVQRVGVKVVREICAVAAAEGAAGVFVVTSGSFTEEARRFVAENRIDIELITGGQLRQMIRGLEYTP
ncbi:MAG: restriction endonuclease [Burkholderiales bacterium]|nr:restriction endonuclease [Burkholderiales bacterium]MDP2396779.1 restriction endonuclease [Burkholderiales bacterium]